MIINSPPNPSVTPDNGAASNLVPGSLQTSVFTVTNTSVSTGAFDFTAACRGTAVLRGCTIAPSSATIAGLANTTVNVQWNAGGAGTSGRIILSATWKGDVKFTDDGSINLTTQAPAAPAATGVTTLGENPGTSLTRDLCLAVGLSRSVASECGDLRISHPLPMVRTVNKARMPVLVYNSATAHPYPSIVVTLARGTGTTAFDSVVGILKINGTQRRRASWTGASLPAGTARQLVLTYDAAADPTGIYSYSAEVTGYVGGIAQPTMTSAGSLAVVNRSLVSPYGVGWWVAGLEQLFTQADSSRLWVGGDGSTRRFLKVNSTTFIAEGIEFPDTLIYTPTPAPKFTRYLPARTRIEFDNNGYHTATVNRLGYTTTMAYTGTGTNTRVQTITVPPTGSGLAYTFVYDASNRLDSVAAPLMVGRSRGTNLTLLADGRVQTIRDPDNQVVSFSYDPTLTRLITSRTDKRLTVTSVTYDSARKVSQATIAMGGAPEVNIVYGLRNRPTQGLNLAVGQATLVDTAVAYTHLNGPRTDVADTTVIWLDRFGSPRRVRNALGHQAVVERADNRFLGLVTATMALNGFWRRGGYDARGNLSRDTLFNAYGTGANAVTQYTWHQTWDAPTAITRPLGDGVTMTYDPGNGNRLTQADGRGAGTTTNFRYGATSLPGLLTSIVYPETRTGETDLDSLAYGSLQNLEHVRTATIVGATTVTTARHFTLDNIGQASSACVDLLPAAGQQCSATKFDIMSRDSIMTETGPAGLINPAQTLTVKGFYDAEGNRTRLERSSIPDIAGTPIGLLATQWGYDRAHRARVEIAPDGARDSSYYGPAGTVDTVATRRGHRLKMTYNLLNQLTQKILPPAAYGPETFGVAGFSAPNANPPYPRLALGLVSPTTIDGDTATFAYDSLGSFVMANNRDARIARTYWPSGALRVETERVRTYADVNFDLHVYPVGYRYDLNGRLETLRSPVLLADTPAGVRDSSGSDTLPASVRCNRCPNRSAPSSRWATTTGSSSTWWRCRARLPKVSHTMVRAGRSAIRFSIPRRPAIGSPSIRSARRTLSTTGAIS